MRKIYLQRMAVAGLLIFVLLSNVAPVFAASGIQKVDDFLDKVASVLKGAGIAVITIFFMVAGYKFLYKHESIGYCARVAGGGILIGAAAEIAAYIMG